MLFWAWSANQAPRRALNSPVFRLFFYGTMRFQTGGNNVKVFHVSTVGEMDLARGKFTMHLLADGPNPLAGVEPHSGHTTLRIFFRMGHADELDLPHAPIYILKVVDCQVRPFLLEILQDEPAVAMIRLRLAAQ